MVNVLVPPQGGGVAGSGHGIVTSVRRLPWSWRRPSTTAQRVEVPREGEVREQHFGLRAQNRPLPGTRPVLPQVGAQRHAVDQIVGVPGLPTLDAPVPLMVEQLVDVLQLLDALIPVPEQVIDVPNFFVERIPPRTSVREPQLAEQVEVPTIISFSSLQRIAEQNLDIPAVGGSGTGGGLSGFFPGQNFSMTAEQIIDNPVPRRSFSGDLQGFSPGQSSSKRTANKIADIPVPSGGLHDFPQTLHRAGVSSRFAGRGKSRVFLALFPG